MIPLDILDDIGVFLSNIVISFNSIFTWLNNITTILLFIGVAIILYFIFSFAFHKE